MKNLLLRAAAILIFSVMILVLYSYMTANPNKFNFSAKEAPSETIIYATGKVVTATTWNATVMVLTRPPRAGEQPERLTFTKQDTDTIHIQEKFTPTLNDEALKNRNEQTLKTLKNLKKLLPKNTTVSYDPSFGGIVIFAEGRRFDFGVASNETITCDETSLK